MCRWVGAALLCMCSAFPAKKGKQMIVTSLSDVTSVMLMHRGRGYRKRGHTSLGAVIWVFGAEHSGNLIGSHWPFVTVTSVPLMEWSAFIQEDVLCLFLCMYPSLSWAPLVGILELFASWPGGGHHHTPPRPGIRAGMDHSLSRQIA